MKFAIVLVLALFAVANARPNDVNNVKSEQQVDVDSYKFAWENDDGTRHSEEGVDHGTDKEHGNLQVHGSFSWKAPDGHEYTVNYVADEHGFQPTGEHLPQQPKITL